MDYLHHAHHTSSSKKDIDIIRYGCRRFLHSPPPPLPQSIIVIYRLNFDILCPHREYDDVPGALESERDNGAFCKVNYFISDVDAARLHPRDYMRIARVVKLVKGSPSFWGSVHSCIHPPPPLVISTVYKERCANKKKHESVYISFSAVITESLLLLASPSAHLNRMSSLNAVCGIIYYNIAHCNLIECELEHTYTALSLCKICPSRVASYL